MSVFEFDLWFLFVCVYWMMICEIECCFVVVGLFVYVWYDVLWGFESGFDGMCCMYEFVDVFVIECYNFMWFVDWLE